MQENICIQVIISIRHEDKINEYKLESEHQKYV
jgi:hypothetical protein